MTWLRPVQGFGGGGGGGSSPGVGVAFVAKVATDGVNIVNAGGVPAVINGVAVGVGDVILEKDQAAPAENGLYQIDVAGPGGTATRIAALDTGTELETFFAVYVREGVVDPDGIYTLITNPPYVIGVTPLSFSLYPSTAVAAGAVLAWGSGGVTQTVTTRFLSPWVEGSTVAPIAPVLYRAPRGGTLRRLRVRQNVPAGNGNPIVYTVRVNGVATLLSVSMLSTALDGANLVNNVVIAAGDLLDIQVTKALDVGVSPTGIVAVLEFA